MEMSFRDTIVWGGPGALRYRYSVRDPQGRGMRGEVFASTQDEALELLQKSGVYVTSLESTLKPLDSLQLKRSCSGDDQRIFLLESWSMFMDMGMSVQTALMRVRKIIREGTISRSLQVVQRGVDGGMRVSEAVCASGLFPLSWLAVLSRGEEVGNLVGPLRAMRRQILQLRKLRGEALQLMFQPAFLIGLCLIWFWVFMRSVVPVMLEFGNTLGVSSPWVLLLFRMSRGLLLTTQILAILLGLAVLAGFRFSRSNQVMGNFQRWIPMRTPVLGPLVSGLHLLVVSSELRLQLEAGIPLETALHTLSLSVPNQEVRRELFEICNNLREGVPADEALCRLSFIPYDQKALISAGCVSGQLSKSLELLIKFGEEDVRFKVHLLVAFLHHGIFLACAFLVGLVMAAYFGLWFSSLSTAVVAFYPPAP